MRLRWLWSLLQSPTFCRHLLPPRYLHRRRRPVLLRRQCQWQPQFLHRPWSPPSLPPPPLCQRRLQFRPRRRFPAPTLPLNVRFVPGNLTIRLSWDPVDGADYYRIHHADTMDPVCSLTWYGNTGSCRLLAGDLTGTGYTDSSPAPGDNHYWVEACNSGGCSGLTATIPPGWPTPPLPTIGPPPS